MLAPVKLPSLKVDDLRFTLQRSPRRKTMQITVVMRLISNVVRNVRP